MWPGLFTKKPQRKRRYLEYVSAYLPPALCHHCPLALESRWRTWFEAIAHHVQVMHVYEGFLKGEGDSANVTKVLEILKDPHRFTAVHTCMMFVVSYFAHVMNVLTWSEGSRSCIAPLVYDKLHALELDLGECKSRSTWSEEIESKLGKLPEPQRLRFSNQFLCPLAFPLSSLPQVASLIQENLWKCTFQVQEALRQAPRDGHVERSCLF